MSKTIFTFTEEFDDAGHLIKRTITTEQGETVLPVTPKTNLIDNTPIIPTPNPWPEPTCSKAPSFFCNHSGGTAHES